MKKITYFLILMLGMSICHSCSHRTQPTKMNFIKDNEKDFESVLMEAKTKNKLIFVDVYTTWCGPCKWMDENVFINAHLAEQFNKKFINYKVNGESFEGVNIGIKYRVDSYPTYIFVDSEGKAVHRIEGTIPAEMLLKEADFAENRQKK
jgi:thioredoxin 1